MQFILDVFYLVKPFIPFLAVFFAVCTIMSLVRLWRFVDSLPSEEQEQEQEQD